MQPPRTRPQPQEITQIQSWLTHPQPAAQGHHDQLGTAATINSGNMTQEQTSLKMDLTPIMTLGTPHKDKYKPR